MFDEIRWARFEEMDKRGCTTAEIVAELGVCARTVNRWRAAAERARQPYVVHPPEAREAARRLLDDGCSISETARSVGVAQGTVRRWFPDVPGWSHREAGLFSAAVRFAGREVVDRAA